MNEIELKPCPFCGGSPRYESLVERIGHGEYITINHVRCTECGASGHTEGEIRMKSEECRTKCIEAWNRRTHR